MFIHTNSETGTKLKTLPNKMHCVKYASERNYLSNSHVCLFKIIRMKQRYIIIFCIRLCKTSTETFELIKTDSLQQCLSSIKKIKENVNLQNRLNWLIRTNRRLPFKNSSPRFRVLESCNNMNTKRKD